MFRLLDTLQRRAAAASILSTDNGAFNKIVPNRLPSCNESAVVKALDEIDRMIGDLLRDGLEQSETQLDEHHLQMEVDRLQADLCREQRKSAQLLEIVRALHECAYCTICMRSCMVPARLDCGHLFCDLCIKDWMMRSSMYSNGSITTCPNCRYPIYEWPEALRIYGLRGVLLALRTYEARL